VKSTLLALAACALCHSADAAVFLFDDFNYADGDLTTVSGGAWTAFSGGGTLPIQVAGSSATVANVVSGTSGEDVRVSLGSGYTTGVLYYSALVTPLSAPTTAGGDYFFSGYSTASPGGGYFGRVFFSTTATGFTFGLSNGGSTPTDWTSDVTINTEYLVVLRLDVAARTATMGVFDPLAKPISDSELTIAGGAASGTTGAIDALALRQGSGSGGFSNQIDAVMVSDSITQLVPEPSSALLAGLGGLMLLRRRR
jgi:hypothetical protein